MSGTFQLDSSLFPKDPLVKRWVRERAGTQGPGEGIYVDVWRLEMSFGTLDIIGESDYFMGKFQESGLHTAVLPHPETSTLTTFTGVAITDYAFSFGDTDHDNYALNPRLILSAIPVVQLSWWNLAMPYRRNIQIDANDALGSDYPIRFYATGTVAADIHALSSVSGEDLRVIYQGDTELDRDLTIYNASEIELFFPLQSAIGGSGSDTTNYYLYYGNKVYPGTALKDKLNIYTFFDGFEDGTLDKWNKNGGLDATNSTAQAFEGSRSMLLSDVSVVDLVDYNHTPTLNLSRVEVIVYIFRLAAIGFDEFVNITFINTSDADIGFFRVEGDTDIIWFDGVTNDTGSELDNSIWTKISLEINTTTDSVIVKKDGSQIYSGGLENSGVNYKTTRLQTDTPGRMVWYADNVIVREIAQDPPDIIIGTEVNA